MSQVGVSTQMHVGTMTRSADQLVQSNGKAGRVSPIMHLGGEWLVKGVSPPHPVVKQGRFKDGGTVAGQQTTLVMPCLMTYVA